MRLNLNTLNSLNVSKNANNSYLQININVANTAQHSICFIGY